MKARPLWQEPAGGGEGRMRVCEFMGMKDGFSQVRPKWCLALTRPVFQQKQNIRNKGLTADWNTSKFNPNHQAVPWPSCAFQYRLWSPWINSKTIQPQRIYVFTYSLGYCFFFSLSLQMGVYLVVSERFIWLSKVGKGRQAFPQRWLSPLISCLTPTFYLKSKYLTSYVVMPQLSTNLQLIKHVAFIINFRGEMFSAWKAEVGVFFPLCFLFASMLLSAPNGQCILCSDKRLITHSFCDTYEKEWCSLWT